MKNIMPYVAFALCLLTQCTSTPESFIVQFDSNENFPGRKFSIRDINPDLPANWDGFEFVTLEFKITTAQRFRIGFTTDQGYNELNVMSYTPNEWNKLAIPLQLYRRLPEARTSQAAVYNQPRSNGWINLGGRRGDLHGVDSIGIRMRAPIGNPEFEIRSISLSVDDPGDEYLGDKPVVDEFGQSNLVEFEDKITTLDQLRAYWEAEEKEYENAPTDFNYSRYGGYLQKQVRATGFFRTEKVDGRWWFVDPDGYLFLSVGIDGVNPGGGGLISQLEKREGMIKQLPPDQFRRNNRGRETADYGAWNLYRRFGDNYREKACQMAIKRLDHWGLNTIAIWANAEVYRLNQKPYMLELSGLGMQGNLMGLADVYAPGFAQRMDEAMKVYLPANKDNPWIIGYFVGNEPAWVKQEIRLCDLILKGEDRPIKTALEKYLQNGDTPERRKQFIYNTFEIFMQTVREMMQQHDPNHLNLGIRFGGISELEDDLLKVCRATFDVLSFNCYALKPDNEIMDRVLRVVDMPMVIGEYHFGTVDRGLAQSLVQVGNQKERGVAYRYYTENTFAHPGMIGAGYFKWCDQEVLGRNDGENYNCGFIDVTDRPYKYIAEAAKETCKRLFSIHSGETSPVDQAPATAPRNQAGIPDPWIK